MAEAIWYFADRDEERGPVTEAQIRSLIGTGNLKRGDLVWKEGMDDWVPAGEIPGLFDAEPAAPPAEEDPEMKRSAAPSPSPLTARPQAPDKTSVPRQPPALRLSLDVTQPIQIFKWGAFLGQPLLLVGFLFVLLTRGCDSLADRYVARAVARAKVAETQFNDEWDARLDKLKRQQEAYRTEVPPPADKLAEVAQAISELETARQEKERELREGKWRELATTARDAEANRDMWRFWREAVFWLSTGLFAVGLLIVGFTGQAAERWLSLVMLAVIVYALYTTT